MTKLSERYQLDLSQTHFSLQIQSHYPDLLLIQPLGSHKLLIACCHHAEHNTILLTPGIIFGIDTDDWTILEIVQDSGKDTHILPLSSEAADLNQLQLYTKEAYADFCDRFAQIILKHWVNDFLLFKLLSEENTSPPPSDPELLDL